MFFKKREYGLCKNTKNKKMSCQRSMNQIKDAMPKKHEPKRKKEREKQWVL
jgi:hypothetical protein